MNFAPVQSPATPTFGIDLLLDGQVDLLLGRADLFVAWNAANATGRAPLVPSWGLGAGSLLAVAGGRTTPGYPFLYTSSSLYEGELALIWAARESR